MLIMSSTLTPSSRGHIAHHFFNIVKEVTYFNFHDCFNIAALLTRKSDTSMLIMISTLTTSSRGGDILLFIFSAFTPSSREGHILQCSSCFQHCPLLTRRSHTSIFIICSTLTPSSRVGRLLQFPSFIQH